MSRMDYLEYLKTAEKHEMMPADLRKWVRWSIKEIEKLRGLLANVHDELHDPMAQFWCDRPEEDRKLLEALRGRIDEAMGYDNE
jgi:hypothetical protein